MSLKNAQITLVNQGLINCLKPLAGLFCLVLIFTTSVQAQSLVEGSKELNKEITADSARESLKEVSKENGKGLFTRVADKLVDSLTGNSENLINQAMEMNRA